MDTEWKPARWEVTAYDPELRTVLEVVTVEADPKTRGEPPEVADARRALGRRHRAKIEAKRIE